NIVTAENTKPVVIEVSKGTRLQANIDPEKVFTSELFADIDTFIERLETGNPEDVNASIEELDDHINNIINARADLGARMNRLELVENRIDEQEVIAKRTMSN